MRISTSSSLMSLFQNQRIEHKQSIKKATILLSNRDSYVKGGDNTSCVYSAKVGLKLGSATSSVLDMINFNYLDIMKQKCDKQFSIIIGGKEYLKSELPTVSADKCKEIKAVNNIIMVSIISILRRMGECIHLHAQMTMWISLIQNLFPGDRVMPVIRLPSFGICFPEMEHI